MLRLEHVDEPVVVVLGSPDGLLERGDPLEVGADRHLPQRNVVRQLNFPGNLRHRRDHDGLGLLWDEPRRAQPLRQIAGPIVPVQLPLEALAELGEHAHLTRDQLIEVVTLGPAEVAIDDEAASSQTEETQERTIPLDGDVTRQWIGNAVPNLPVVGGQQL